MLGGLSIDLKTMRATLVLSMLVASVGVTAPIGLSFALQGLFNITPLQAFTAGAALCSTSLGTTFTVLTTSGLTESRLGVVLASAAMMDDVVGLIMVQVISTLGNTAKLDVATIVRPIGVSLAFACVMPLLCVFGGRRIKMCWQKYWCDKTEIIPAHMKTFAHLDLVLHTATLIALITAASYAGASNLFAAYLAGACISYLHAIKPTDATTNVTTETRLSSADISGQKSKPPVSPTTESEQATQTTCANRESSAEAASLHELTDQQGLPMSEQPTTEAQSQPDIQSSEQHAGRVVYDRYFGPVVNAMLKPFFFASIGFSIPISELFAGNVVWRGIVYAVLMIVGKLLCGTLLLRLGQPLSKSRSQLGRLVKIIRKWRRLPSTDCSAQSTSATQATSANQATTSTRNSSNAPQMTQEVQREAGSQETNRKPLSLYPAAILGTAMVARGEIGFLISSIAESNGSFEISVADQSSELFLVVTWAILICTIIGPLAVGLLVRRVRKLQEVERSRVNGRTDPLGDWGLIKNLPTSTMRRREAWSRRPLPTGRH